MINNTLFFSDWQPAWFEFILITQRKRPLHSHFAFAVVFFFLLSKDFVIKYAV